MGDQSREAMGEVFDRIQAEKEAPDPVVSTPPPSEPEPTPSAPAAAAPSEPAAPAEQTKADRARDEVGRFSKKPAEPPSGKTKADAGGVKADGAGIDPPLPAPSAEPVPKPAAETHKAPASLSPVEREAWDKAPAELQRAFVRIDKEVRQTMQKAAESTKKWSAIEEAARPYEHMIRAQGGDNVRGYASYLQTVAVFQTGTPQQKAQLLASLYKSYLPQNEEGINLFAAAVDGKPEQSQGTQNLTPQMVQQLVAQQIQQFRAQSVTQQGQSELAKFESDPPEFYGDVRDDMALILQHAAGRGVAMTLQDAYNRALRHHQVDDESEIGKVLRQREAAKAAANASASTQRAQLASSSVKSNPASQMNGAKAMTRREVLAAAWEAKAGR